MKFKTKFWFRIHSFTGVLTGLLLFFICWTGTFATISFELDWLVNPSLKIKPQSEKATWGSIFQLAQKQFPDAEISYLQKPKYSTSPYIAFATFPDDSYRAIYINPYTSEIVHMDYVVDIANFFRNLHYNLFGVGNDDIGSYLVMIFGLVMFTSLISALFLYKRWWTKFFKFKFNKKGKAFWTQFHKLAGVWSIWFLFVIALSGSYYLYEKFQWDTGLLGPQKLNYLGSEKDGVITVPEVNPDPVQHFLSLDSLLQIAHERWPDLEVTAIFFNWPQEDKGSISIQGHAGSLLSRSFIRERGNQINLDRRTGQVLVKTGTSDLPVFWVISNAVDPVHFGNFGGLISKIVWFIFGLILCGLILSGTYLHIKKLHKNNGVRLHGWRGTWWAVGFTLVIIIATIPYGLEDALWYGPLVDGKKELPTLYPGVKYFIISWSVFTFGIIATWVWMLWKSTKKAQATRITKAAKHYI